MSAGAKVRWRGLGSPEVQIGGWEAQVMLDSLRRISQFEEKGLLTR